MGATTLRQVLYVSSAVEPMTKTEIDEILEQARRQNALTGITGVLFYLEGNFLQLLEGEDPALEQTFQRIKADTRHRNLIQLWNEDITERSFADWAMGFRLITVEDMRNTPELFAAVDGQWQLRREADLDKRLKIFFDTFLRVNESRGY